MFSTSGGEVLERNTAQRWNNGGMWLQGSGAYNPDGGLGGTPGAQTYGHIFGSGRFAAGRQLAHRLRRAGSPAITGYMRFYDISYLDRLVNDLFVEDDAGPLALRPDQLLFPGPALHRRHRAHSLCPAASWNYTYIPIQKCAGRPASASTSTASRIGRDDQRNDQRLTSEVNWKEPIILGDGQLWTFMLDARGDAYHFDDAAGGPRRAPATTRWNAAPPMRRWTGAGPSSPKAAPAIPISCSPSPRSCPALWRQSRRAAPAKIPRTSNSTTTISSASTSCRATT